MSAENAPTQRQPPRYGEFAPFFAAVTDQNPQFHFASLGGRWIVMMFFGTLAAPASMKAYQTILSRRAMFDDENAFFWGVSIDPNDRHERGIKNSLPGLRYFWDFDRSVSQLYGVAHAGVYTPAAFLIDRFLRVVSAAPISQIEGLLNHLDALLRDERSAADLPHAPVLTIPRIFEPELCSELVAYYERIGGEVSGFMSEENGLTVGRHDDRQKRRRDVTLKDETLIAATRGRITLRLIPAVERALGWRATRVERYIVSCYSSEEKGFFFPHRDNTSPATAHRKYAVTINLNADAYDGGELRFPEFGRRLYKPPTGGATVFCCSLLHEATPVTRGARYAFLPFLYDEEGKRVREATKHTIVPGVTPQGTPMPAAPSAAEAELS